MKTSSSSTAVGPSSSSTEDAPDMLLSSSPMRSSAEEEEEGSLLDNDEERATNKELSHLVGSHQDDNHDDEENDDGDNPESNDDNTNHDLEDDFEDEVTSHRSGGSRRSRNNSNSQRPRRSSWQRFWHKPLLPDHRTSIYGIPLVDGPVAVKLIKFVLVTLLGVCFMHWFVRAMNWENRGNWTLSMFWTYESTMVVCDAIMFFVVARLFQQRGVDHLAWMGTVFAANVYASFITNFPFLQHSVTLYQMHCVWPAALWIFVLLLIPLIGTIVFLHIQYAVQHGIFVQKVLELALAVIFLLLPYTSSSYLHLHHWYVGWLLGMHCNFNTWWSRATLAWCWGLYINGIAVYGRDPVLTCGYTLFLSVQQRCPYLDCYIDGLRHPPNTTNTAPDTTSVVHEMNPPDWRNCSADAYHP